MPSSEMSVKVPVYHSILFSKKSTHIKNINEFVRRTEEMQEISPSTQSSVDANAGSEH